VIPWWAGIALVLVALGAALGLVRVYQRRYEPPPETPRKMVHIFMGLVALSFPWVFAQRWPVMVLGVLATGAMLAVRLVGPLRKGVGSVLHSVDRSSLGEVCFPLSIAIVWWLSYGEPLLYVIPVLMLTLADAVAAIVGLRYGRRRYSTAEAPKTVEGSVAFFVVSFLSVTIPLYFFSDVAPTVILLIAVLLSTLVVLFEAIAWRGLDNLFVPLGAYVFLNAQIDEPAAWLLLQIGVLMALMGLGIWYRSRTTLTDNGALAAVLAGYTFWVLGGWEWLVAPITFFLAYAVVTPLTVVEKSRIHDMRAVMGYSAPCLWWVFIAYSTGHTELLYAFTLSLSAGLAMFGVDRTRRVNPDAGFGVLAVVVLTNWALMMVPWVFIEGVSASTVALALVGLAGTAIAAIAILGVERLAQIELEDGVRWFAQAVIAFIVSLSGAVAMGMVTL